MRRSFLLLGLLSLPLAAACGANGDEPPPGPGPVDAGPVIHSGDAGRDSGPGPRDAGPQRDASDAGQDDPGDAEPPPPPEDAGDAAPPPVPPQGTKIATGSDLAVMGITSDANVIYESKTTDTLLYSIPVTGSHSSFVGSVPDDARIVIDGTSLRFSSPLPFDVNGSARALAIWTSAHGMHTVSEATFEAQASISPDGTKVAYIDGDEVAMTVALKVAATGGAATPPTTMLTMKGLGEMGYTPTGTLIINYVSLGSASLYLDSVGIFAPGSVDELHVVARGAVPDPTGKWLWTMQADGSASLVSVADGKTVFTDPVWTPAVFDAAGTSLAYLVGSSVKRVTLSATPAVTTLLANGCTHLYTFSPDDKTLLFATGLALPDELQAVSVDGATAPWTVTGGDHVTSAAFTRGGAHVVFGKQLASGQNGLVSVPLHGGPTTVLSANQWSTVFVGDDSVLTSDQEGSLSVVNASDGSSRLVVSQERSGDVSPDGKWIVYSTNVAPAGVYRYEVQ